MCGCGNTDGFLSSEQEFGTCDLSCGGSESETCGGALAYALYQIEGIALIPSDSGEGMIETVQYQMLAPRRTSPNPYKTKTQKCTQYYCQDVDVISAASCRSPEEELHGDVCMTGPIVACTFSVCCCCLLSFRQILISFVCFHLSPETNASSANSSHFP